MTGGTPDPTFLELQTAVAGRYSLEREVGRGGMGVVYLARDVTLERPVAIKLLPPDLATRPGVRERFLREARIAARLAHPNIVPIHAVEEVRGLVFYVMAYVPGESLGVRLRRGGPVAAGEVGRILREVAWALDYAHQQGVVHRDVKADNILIDPTTRRTLVADFGIAAAIGATTEPVAGTVPAMSPEQALGTAVDGRSDLYSLGVVGYLALSGKLPYPAETVEQLVGLQAKGPPPPLGRAAPQAPRALARAIERCLNHSPEGRFQTAGELAGALDQLAAGPTELPAPLRVWLTRDQRGRSAIVLWSLLTGLPLLSVFFTIAQGFGPPLLAALLMVGFSQGPWLVYALARLLRTRKLLKAGYSHQDLLLAIRTHTERLREELAFEIGSEPSILGRILRVATWGGLGGAVVLTVLIFGSGGRFFEWAWIATAALVLGGGLLGLIFPGRKVPTKKISWRERFWAGPVGRMLVKLAGWRLGRTAAPELTFHRPTEIALGEAAEVLFRALPAGHRRDLAELPKQIEALARQGQHLRSRIEELDDLIAQGAPSTLVDGGRSRGDGGAGPLTEAREALAGHLKDTVAMLETLRVGLLRLHAGSVSPEALTADLTMARAIGAQLREISAAHDELGRWLGHRAPTDPAAT